MAFDQQKTIILLVAVLLAVVAGSVTVLLFLPGRDSDESTALDPVGTAPVTQSNGFNLRVFDRSDFRALDQRLIQENSLPVRPPEGLGKANPFL